jgi:hypothetical protein
LLISLVTIEGYGQIAVNGKKTIPITDGPKLGVSKRKKVKILKKGNKLKTEDRGGTFTNFKGVGKFKGNIVKNKFRKKKSRAAKFTGNSKIAKNSNSKKKSTASFSGNYKSRRENSSSYASARKFKGNLKAKRNSRRISLNKLRTAYVKVTPLKKRGNPSIRKYSGNMKLNRKRSFKHKVSGYRGDMNIKKSRIASRKQAKYNGGPTNALDRAKYRNQIIKNSRRKPGEYGKRPKKRNRKKQKLKYDTRESTIWNN